MAIKALIGLRKNLSLPNGIPSHDTFGSVMGRINKEAFALLFSQWMASVEAGKHIALDGKFIGGGFADKDAIHLVTAFASETRMVLAQHQVSDKQNEITALPKLLEMLDLKDSVVSADAIYCQKDITKQLVKAKADSVLSLKNKHKRLYIERRYYLTSLEDTEQFAQTVRQHWTIENQQHWVLDVCFSEDDNRARQNNQRSNRALINRSALNLLRANDDSNLSIKRRRI